MDHLIRVELAAMTTAENVAHWCSELYVDGHLTDASPWTTSVADAIRAGREMREAAVSDLAYREARYEAHRLFTHAA